VSFVIPGVATKAKQKIIILSNIDLQARREANAACSAVSEPQATTKPSNCVASSHEDDVHRSLRKEEKLPFLEKAPRKGDHCSTYSKGKKNLHAAHGPAMYDLEKEQQKARLIEADARLRKAKCLEEALMRKKANRESCVKAKKGARGRRTAAGFASQTARCPRVDLNTPPQYYLNNVQGNVRNKNLLTVPFEQQRCLLRSCG
jgi:hypothetical protein